MEKNFSSETLTALRAVREKVSALEDAARAEAELFFSNLLSEGWKKINFLWWHDDEEGDEEYFIPQEISIPGGIEKIFQSCCYDDTERELFYAWVGELEVVYSAIYNTSCDGMRKIVL